jgi:hypothetical protein
LAGVLAPSAEHDHGVSWDAGSLHFAGRLANLDPAPVVANVTDSGASLPAGFSYRVDGDLDFTLAGPYSIFTGEGSFTITAIAPANTPVGNAVTVSVATASPYVDSIHVEFSEVSAPGTTTATVTDGASAVVPPNFVLGDPAWTTLYFELSTTATVSPPITVFFDLQIPVPAGLAPTLRVWHAASGVYEDVPTTVRAGGYVVYATVDSLSPFALALVGPEGTAAIPPDAATGKCEGGIAKATAKLARAIVGCHVKTAAGAFKVAPGSFDWTGCEATARAKFDAAVAKLQSCPACAVANAPTLADATSALLHIVNPSVYCTGTQGQGGDTLAALPPDKPTAVCEQKHAKAVAKLTAALLTCHMKAASAGLIGKPFDALACESAARAKYDAIQLTGCQACTATGRVPIRVQIESGVDRTISEAYCATPPAPTTTTTLP